MAKRPSVKEILEAARQGGPPPPAAPPADASPAPAAPPPADPPPAAPEPAPASPPPTEAEPASPPPAKPAGRPMTMQEKLAAARANAAPPQAEPTAPTPAEAEPAPASPPPVKPAGRPMTMQEKLAAARGNAAPAPSPPVKAPVAAEAPAAQPAAARVLPPIDQITDPKDLAEALRQAGARRDDEAAAKAAPPPKPAAKPAPAKTTTVLPAPDREAVVGRKKGPTREVGRRWFMAVLSPVAVGWSSLSAGLGALTVMFGRFMFPNVLAEPPSTVKVGLPTNFDPEAVSERFKAEWGFWIVRSTLYDGQDAIFALKAVCTHLGCPPNWLANDQKFKCPCHGSGFNIAGVNFEGPAPRPLERYKVALADDGQIIVDKSQWFQQELGQWSDPDSFIPV